MWNCQHSSVPVVASGIPPKTLGLRPKACPPHWGPDGVVVEPQGTNQKDGSSFVWYMILWVDKILLGTTKWNHGWSHLFVGNRGIMLPGILGRCKTLSIHTCFERAPPLFSWFSRETQTEIHLGGSNLKRTHPFSRKHGEGFFRWVHLSCSHESHYKESLQQISIMKVIARSHCKESLQGIIIMKVIARSHCKESLQWLLAMTPWTKQGVKCKLQVQGVKCNSLARS